MDTRNTARRQGTVTLSYMPNLSVVPIADARATYRAAIPAASARVLTEATEPISLAGTGYQGIK